MGVVEPVDEMEVARPATRGADGELTGDGSVAGGGEGRRLFVADVAP
jgi:hypothetical protein